MQYSKKPLTITEQINQLEIHGLKISDNVFARHYLQNVSYYRLKAYTYPFRNQSRPSVESILFQKNIDFKDIVDLYVFDRRLRILIINELEKIEVSLRTQLSLSYALQENDAFWYTNRKWYGKTDENAYRKLLTDIENDVARSNEEFIKHFQGKYVESMPPSWMALEVVSFGTLSRMYHLLGTKTEKRTIAKFFGIGNEEVFSNWLHAFSNLRNCCAHHSRIWNRRFIVRIKLPYNTLQPFLTKDCMKKLKQNKLFALLSAIKYIVDLISPGNSFKKNLKALLDDEHRLLSLKEMGFPEDWERQPVWK